MRITKVNEKAPELRVDSWNNAKKKDRGHITYVSPIFLSDAADRNILNVRIGSRALSCENPPRSYQSRSRRHRNSAETGSPDQTV